MPKLPCTQLLNIIVSKLDISNFFVTYGANFFNKLPAFTKKIILITNSSVLLSTTQATLNC